MLKKLAAAAILAAAAVIAVPTAANALGGGYGENSEVVVSGDAVPGGTVVVSFLEGSFEPGETVQFGVSGATSVQLASTSTVVTTLEKDADADGSVDLSITFPADARGAYDVAAIAASGIEVARVVVSEDGSNGGGTGTGTGAGTGSTTGGGLASTGQDVPMTALFVGGGALLLGGLVMGAVYTTRRRSVARQN